MLDRSSSEVSPAHCHLGARSTSFFIKLVWHNLALDQTRPSHDVGVMGIVHPSPSRFGMPEDLGRAPIHFGALPVGALFGHGRAPWVNGKAEGGSGDRRVEAVWCFWSS